VSFAYCSDTAYSEKILPYIEGVDCLFHEATFLDVQKGRARETMHSTALQAAEIAAKAKVKRLVIGHFSARYEDHKDFLSEARSVFENTELAEDGRVFRF
jgi:ribonuclease Z